MIKRLLPVVAVALCVASVVADASGVVEQTAASPYRTAIESAVAKGHPRLFADAAAFGRLKDAVKEPGLRQVAAMRVRERAEQLLDKPPLKRQMIGRRLLHVSRKALYRISTLAMAYRLTDERKFLDRAVAEMKAVCAFSDWNSSHFLDTGEMSLAVAIGYDWLYDDLSDVCRAEIRAGLAKNGLAAGVLGGWWTKSRNNWGQVCRAGMIAASLSLADDPQILDVCAKMLGESVEALPLSMEAMAPDGCYPEGTGYWHYGVSFNVFAIAMLESACGTDFGLSDQPGFKETADYPNAVTGPTGLTIAYSDCGSSRGAMQPLWWFTKKLNRPDLVTEREIAAWCAAPSGEGWLPPVELFWMDDRAGETVRHETASLVWAPRGVVPLAILRSGWGKDDAFAGIKGGSPRTNHGHMDGGNFVLDMGGVRWAWELPHEDYNRIEQMKGVSLWNMSQESGRWSLLRLNTFGHNVPSIDGEQQAVDGFAKVLNAVVAPLPSAELDLTSLYPAAKKVLRWCTLGKGGRSFFVQDAFEGLKPGATVRWQFILKAKAEVDDSGGRSALKLTEQGRALVVLRQGTAATPWQVEPAEGPQPLNSPNPGFSRAFFTLTADANGRASTEVAFILNEPDVVAKGDR